MEMICSSKVRSLVLAASLSASAGFLSPAFGQGSPPSFFIRALGNRCVDFGGEAWWAVGAPVFIYSCNGTVAQQVRIVELDNSHDVALLVPGTSFCIGVRGGVVTPNQPLELQTCAAVPSQRFALDGDAIMMGTQGIGERVSREYVIEPAGGAGAVAVAVLLWSEEPLGRSAGELPTDRAQAHRSLRQRCVFRRDSLERPVLELCILGAQSGAAPEPPEHALRGPAPWLLRQNIFKVSIGNRISNIKIHRVKNDILGKMGSFKTDHPDFHFLKNGQLSLSLTDFATEPLCDFDGDRIDDLFLATGKTWWFSSFGEFPWSYLTERTERLDQVRLGYFDNDLRCDVLTESGGQWVIASGGTGPGRASGRFYFN